MPLTPRGERTRRHIVERCAVVFDQRGFRGATLSEMVTATGLTRGAFYFHFDSKDSLAGAIVEQQATAWPQLLQAASRTEPDPMRRLIRLVFASAALFQTDVVVRAASRLASEKALIEQKLPEIYHWWVHTTHDLLDEADSAGQLSGAARSIARAGPRGAGTSGAPGPAGIRSLAEYLVASYYAHGQAVGAGGLDDLPGRVYTGWRMAISAVCRAPEPRESLLALTEELIEQWRNDPHSLFDGALPWSAVSDAGDALGAPEVEDGDDETDAPA